MTLALSLSTAPAYPPCRERPISDAATLPGLLFLHSICQALLRITATLHLRLHASALNGTPSRPNDVALLPACRVCRLHFRQFILQSHRYRLCPQPSTTPESLALTPSLPLSPASSCRGTAQRQASRARDMSHAMDHDLQASCLQCQKTGHLSCTPRGSSDQAIALLLQLSATRTLMACLRVHRTCLQEHQCHRRWPVLSKFRCKAMVATMDPTMADTTRIRAISMFVLRLVLPTALQALTTHPCTDTGQAICVPEPHQ